MPVRRVLSLVAAVTVLAGCTHGNDYYSRDPYINGSRIDRGLSSAEHDMAKLLSSGDGARILTERTAPPWRAAMVHFLRGYGGRPVAIARMTAGDDATADEALLVTCQDGSTQRVTVSWGWFDGAWRAWPDSRLTAADQPVDYPGCR